MNYRNPVYHHDGRINCEIEHPAYGWIPTTLAADDADTAELFAVVAAGDVAPAPAPILADVQAAKLAEINRAYQAAMAVILDAYPQAETLTFDKQEREARAWQADNATATPYIDAMLVERPLTKAELVGRIIAKADQFTQLSGEATGKRQRLEESILAATDAATVEGITW